MRDGIHKYYLQRKGKEQSACEKWSDDGNSYIIPAKAFEEITFPSFQPQIYICSRRLDLHVMMNIMRCKRFGENLSIQNLVYLTDSLILLFIAECERYFRWLTSDTLKKTCTLQYGLMQKIKIKNVKEIKISQRFTCIP